jgi:glycosyltransferase involved in cell wall biosynthesis
MSIVQIPILSTNQNIDQKALNKDIVNKWKKPYIVHTGSITQNKDGILTILKGIGEYNKKYLSAPLNFYCSGVLEESMVYSEIIKLLEIYKLQNNVFFTGYLSDAELENLLINSLLSVVYKVSNEQNKYCFPTKIASYLSYGIPLIVTNVGPMGDEFTNNNNALVIKEGCTESLVEAVFRIANDEELRNDLSRNGLKLLRDRYSIVANSKRMKVFFTDLINVD